MYAEICKIIVQWSEKCHIILPMIRYNNFSITSTLFKHIKTFLD